MPVIIISSAVGLGLLALVAFSYIIFYNICCFIGVKENDIIPAWICFIFGWFIMSVIAYSYLYGY